MNSITEIEKKWVGGSDIYLYTNVLYILFVFYILSY